MRKLREECGVFGIIDNMPFHAAGYAASALLSLQHRGQEGAGIAWFNDFDQVQCRKDTGLVSDVFSKKVLSNLPESRSAVGHVRYSTTGQNNAENTQPIVTGHAKVTLALAHNGNITNAAAIRNKMIYESGRVFHTTNDTEILNKLIVDGFIKEKNIEKAVFDLLDEVEGAYSVVVLTADKLIALRDKNGFRPLCMGRKGSATVFASESCALDSIGAEFVRDVKPGELISVDINGKQTIMQHDLDGVKRGHCVFEYIYFARPDSVIDSQSVYNSRLEMGRALARQVKTDADIVCGVPDSGLDAAFGYHLESGIPYGPAFVKNRYVGRSFIVPDQISRENTVNVKLNPLRASIDGKRVVLVDDSIVRGTTCARTIKALKNAGAKEVHMRISAPPFRYECFFGTDIDSRENLIANKHDIEEIRRIIGADSLEYLSVENLRAIFKGRENDFCTGCFTGDYPITVNADGDKSKFDD